MEKEIKKIMEDFELWKLERSLLRVIKLSLQEAYLRGETKQLKRSMDDIKNL